ncbi:hypothetical protein C1646_774255 [Rhizophagus diaphanus]|nr:hypothetical protein C1646_774255 [Rhizophagus diaphanus] [Rhizophagus sp. MUCL 43196]
MGCKTDNYRCPTKQKQQVQSTGSESHNLSVEEVYDKEELATKLVVKDHNADMYRVFHSREDFWKFHDNVTEHLRSFSEVVYGDLPQFSRIHVEFGSLNKFPGTKIVNLLGQVLDGMLDVFRNRYSGIMNVLNSSNDFVVMDEYGQNRHGYWTNDFHIQATSFAFADYKEAKEFTLRVRSSLPVEVGRFVSLQYNDPIQLVPILGSTCPKETLHKKISRFSQFLGTNVNIHKNELFVKKFPELECAHLTPIANCDTLNECAHSTPKANCDTLNECVQPTQSVRSSSSNKHGTMNASPHSVTSGNDFTVQQQTTSLEKQDNSLRRPHPCGEDWLQNQSNRGDEQSYSTGEEQKGTITTLLTKKDLPLINNQYAIAINYLVLFFFIANAIKRNNTRQMRGGTHITKTKIPQKKKNSMVKKQLNQRLHSRSAIIGKDPERRNGNQSETVQEQNVQFKDCSRKNETNNWKRMLVSMIALVCNVIFVHKTSKMRTHGPIPHMVIAITPSCQSYQFNPP